MTIEIKVQKTEVTVLGAQTPVQVMKVISEGTPGPAGLGWTPVFAIITDGARRVYQITDWTGGTGSKPATGQYVSVTGFTAVLTDAVDVRGDTGVGGATGAEGDDGWSPITAIVIDGERRVLQVTDWTGGTGIKPAVPRYIGAAGFTTVLSDAIDIRGSIGATGASGATGGTGAGGATGPAGTEGDDGWSPVTTIISDGSRRVLQVSDWTGGTGTKPAFPRYISASGFTTVLANAIDIRGSIGATGAAGAAGATGATGPAGATGAEGDDGWSPITAIVTDGARRVLQVTDWTGGTGTKPAAPRYISASGFTTVLADAIDIRGTAGATGGAGATGAAGADGWSPITAIVTDGERRVLQVTDWTGGTGTKPAFPRYISASGFTTVLSDAIDIRGAAGSGSGSSFTVYEVPTFVGNATTDTATFAAALATGKPILLTAPVTVNATLVPLANQEIKGVEGADIIVSMANAGPGTIFNLNGLTGVKLKTFKIDGNKANTSSLSCITMASSLKCSLIDLDLLNVSGPGEGAVLLSGTAYDNHLERVNSVGSESTAIGISGALAQRNTVIDCGLETNGLFGVRLGEGANGNLIMCNRTTDSVAELVGVTSDCHSNRILGNHAENTGDNGISVSGYDNLVANNHCVLNDRAGIWIWGSFNTVVGNVCKNNNLDTLTTFAGIGVSSNYGGTGQHNTIVGNTIDDSQATPTQRGVRIAGTGYTTWVTGQVIVVGDYRVFGLNIYYATSAGTTGATAPVHTSGTVTDGTVSWRYTRSFLLTASSNYNVVSDNKIGRFFSAAYFDSANWVTNTLDETTTGLHGLRANQHDFYANNNLNLSLISGYAQFSRGMVYKRTATTVSYTILTTDYLVEVTSTAAARTITLPATGRVTGMMYIIKDTSGGAATNNITIERNTANIDGGTVNPVINANHGWIIVYWNGTQWSTIKDTVTAAETPANIIALSAPPSNVVVDSDLLKLVRDVAGTPTFVKLPLDVMSTYVSDEILYPIQRVITTASTITRADHRKFIDVAGLFTVTPDAAATLGNGFWVDILNTGTSIVTIAALGLSLFPKQAFRLMSNGTSLSARNLTRNAEISRQTLASGSTTVAFAKGWNRQRLILDHVTISVTGNLNMQISKAGAVLASTQYFSTIHYPSAATSGETPAHSVAVSFSEVMVGLLGSNQVVGTIDFFAVNDGGALSWTSRLMGYHSAQARYQEQRAGGRINVVGPFDSVLLTSGASVLGGNVIVEGFSP